YVGAGDLPTEKATIAGETLANLNPTQDATRQATCRNEQQEVPATYENGFTATKLWDDNNNAYDFRPGEEDFKKLLTLKRSAPAQNVPGGGGAAAIPEEEVPCKLTITPDSTDESKWIITIQPVDSSSFEKYAPNGMAWQYTFEERTTNNNRLQLNFDDPDAPENNIYAPPADSGGQWGKTLQASSGITDFGELTNTTHMSYQFRKEWVDADGEKITQNYLGDDFELTVNFQLQVSTDGADWKNAGAYFAEKHISIQSQVIGEGVTQGTWDTASITNTIDTDVWNSGGTFTGLPTVILENDKYISLQYRVIETSVTYGNQITQTITAPTNLTTTETTTTGSYTVENPDRLVTSATFTRYDDRGVSVSTNRLSTTEVSLEKVWDDAENPYNTRPDPDAPMTWTAWFVLQRSTNDTDWTHVDVVKLYGGNQQGDTSGERWEYTFSGLPTMDYQTSQPYTYRVRELQPKAEGYTLPTVAESDLVMPGGTYNPGGSAYTTQYENSAQHWTVTNILDRYTPQVPVKEVTAVKNWAVPDTAEKPPVTFQLQYRTETSDWQSTATAGFTNAEQTADAANGWRVTWTSLPDTIAGKNVTYRVVELAGTGWVELTQQSTTADGGTLTNTFTNTFARDFAVGKKWNPTSATAHPVTIALYRTTNPDNVGAVTEERVPVNEMVESEGFRTVELNDINQWSHTFTALPQYDQNKNLYIYYGLELDSNGNPVAENETVTLEGDRYAVTYRTDESGTVVTNTTVLADLAGTKTWLDNGNEGDTRPSTLPLILERKIDSDTTWTPVTGVVPTWDTTTYAAKNQWVYTYSGLPTHDEDGNLYSYRVREQVPSGYTLQQEVTPGQGDVLANENGAYNFTNLRTGTVTLQVQKIWVGDQAADRPSNIRLKVERKPLTAPDTAWVDCTPFSQPAWSKTGDTWFLTYPNLPQFNNDGVRYEYRITEDGVPDGYEVKNSTNTDPLKVYTLENIRKGALTIRKTVSGNRGETDRMFHFTITFTGTSQAGTLASQVNGHYTAVYTGPDGTTEPKTISFTTGVSESIALEHGETITIHGLPAGLTYTVTETEADQNGYSTSGSGQQGIIPAGDTAQAAFENYRNSSSSVSRIDISGTKTWVGDTAEERPANLQLKLYRCVDGGAETLVNAQPTWTKGGNVWTYRYSNLPKYASNGKAYTYRVEEVVPAGYVSDVNGYHFTNTLQEDAEKVTLTGIKRWVGDTADNRPASITVVLYDGSGQEVSRIPVTATEGWRYTFEDLPKYDALGQEIAYSLREDPVPTGYQVSYNGWDITNQKEGESFGSLRVTKEVTGTGAEYDRAFSFTVTLDDWSINGTYGDMTFVRGVANFTLKHGQAVTAAGLPEGTAYTVTEEKTAGYHASALSSPSGTIVQNTQTTVSFVNTVDSSEVPTEYEDPAAHQAPETPQEATESNTPQGSDIPTGDQSHLILYGWLSALFAGGLTAILYYGKKRNTKS
ncbi:MAG: Cna B-type domain-containing protein, partial [Butyricicoccus sp.]|nr:Cna B-type domain-containing protein [Butyricicoccus sp.]